MPPPSRPASTTSGVAPRRRRWLLAAALVFSIGAAALLAFTPAGPAVRHAANQVIETCRAAGPLVFFSAMALLPLAGFPLAPFTLTAGPVFGPALGLGAVVLWSFVAVTVNVALSYWIATSALRPAISSLLRRLGWELPRVDSRSAWLLALVVRIVPGPPFFLQSYLLGLARVPFRVYLIVSTLVPFGYIACVVVLGDALARGNLRAALEAVALMTVIGGVIHQLRRRLAPRILPSEGKSSN
ncbi:MAG TPA: VTT domain-containing protein [Opitutus sp.]|nr:VTT domain-containing protein [Opitutus sp.]